MMASPSELSFDCKPQIHSMLQEPFGDEASEQAQKLQDFVSRLEEERLKIDAFKRELPLCMQLLSNAMEASRQQLQCSQGGRPVLEEFIPLKNMNHNSSSLDVGEGNVSADKASWMTSAQLWNQETDIKLGLNSKQRINGAGAFLPFASKDRGSSPSGEGYPELALSSSSHKEEAEEEKRNSPETKNGGGEREQNGSQSHRKARRCWSPELHRRFVNALHMLGGSQATPKQIREVMKVDGLSNDEVKSHLQKYRLHTRRPSPTPLAAAAPQVVFLGGIWVPPEYAAEAAAVYGSATHHHVSPPNLPPPNRQQLHLYGKPPVRRGNSSPESDGGGDPSESIEDGKSESGSWKADSICLT